MSVMPRGVNTGGTVRKTLQCASRTSAAGHPLCRCFYQRSQNRADRHISTVWIFDQVFERIWDHVPHPTTMAPLSFLLKPQIRRIKLQVMVKLMLACEDRKYGVNVRYVQDPSCQILYFAPLRMGKAGAYQKYGVTFTPVGVKRTVACPTVMEDPSRTSELVPSFVQMVHRGHEAMSGT
ncbi:hypothetical protein B0H14DRAFT_2594581 [Mycena olivaceomarginata]|nr:hypothetical protein B0H14DRAFT_2594581 [Mycena olivaceomarginata]